jgi:hypothetical protein
VAFSALTNKPAYLLTFHKFTDTTVGLGQGWLSKAQAPLARIHRDEGSSGSSGSSGSTYFCLPQYNQTDEEADIAAAEARKSNADYVEARTILMPAVDFFERAVAEARSQGVLTGQLLAQVSALITSSVEVHLWEL